MTSAQGLSDVSHVVLVMSGKGGVGKSTLTTQMAIGLWRLGYAVGVLDIDLCGPSIPKMFGVEGKRVFQCPDGWAPIIVETSADDRSLVVMSIGFLLENQDDAVIWRGPKKHSMINQLLLDVRWGKLDFLLVDTPPGTSDEHISIIEKLVQNPALQPKLAGTVMVTTPQAVALGDVRRQISMCTKIGVPIIGIVENMSGFACQHCGHCSNIFSKGGGEALAKDKNITFLGHVPMDFKLTKTCDTSTGLSVELNSDIESVVKSLVAILHTST